MARKLFIMVALISLVSLGQAVPGLGATYNLTGVEYLGGEVGGVIRDTWRHNFSGGIKPWATMSEFIAGGPLFYASDTQAIWRIGVQDNINAGDGVYKPYWNLGVGQETGGGYREIIFDSTLATPDFFVKLPDNTFISSTKLTSLTYTVKFTENAGPVYVPSNDAEISGVGINDGDGSDFWFRMVLINETGNHSHNRGYLESFTVITNYDASAVPLPGAVWLLGTGLLGLACVGWRRRN